MSYNDDFVHYLESTVSLDVLDSMTAAMGEDLQNCQQAMNRINGLIDSLPKNAQDVTPEPNSGFRHEDLSNLMNDSAPNLLMPDMVDNTYDVDLNDVIATLKSYADDIKKNLSHNNPVSEAGNVKKDLVDLDLGQYASSLDGLCKRLNNVKLNKEDEDKNPELENKLSVLCDDVNMFSQMVKANTTLCEANKSWTPISQPNDALNYNHILDKLLSCINEVSYLLHSKNKDTFH